MELSFQSYFVCEEQGSISLEIIRKGNLAESSYVTVEVSRLFRTQTRRDAAFRNLTLVLGHRWRR